MQVDDYVKVKDEGKYSWIKEIRGKKAKLEDDSWVSLSKLEYVAPRELTESELRNYFRMNEFYYDSLEDNILESNYVCDIIYTPTKEDLLALLMNIKIKDIDLGQFFQWSFATSLTLINCYGINEGSEDELDKTLLKKDGDLFDFVFEEIGKAVKDNGDDKYFLIDMLDIDELIEVVRTHIQNEKNGVRLYTEKEKDKFVTYVDENNLLKEFDEEYKQLYKQFVLDLVEKENQTGMEAYASGCYGGNEVFECDWFKARDTYEKLYAEYGYATYANSLGYIYYYGRTNNGIAQDDLAFKYFSVGAASGLYQSSYKQADMFYYGRGVVENKRIAIDIYFKLYWDCKKLFEKGFYDCEFADIALRLGTTFMSKTNPSYNVAYYYLLQAQFAIDQRKEQVNLYGDDVVKNKIAEAMENCHKQIDVKPTKKIEYEEPSWIKDLTEDNQRIIVHIKKYKNAKLKMTFSALANTEGETQPHLFTFVGFNKCILTDTIVARAVDKYDFDLNSSYIITHYEIDDTDTVFYFYEKEVFRIATDLYTIEQRDN